MEPLQFLLVWREGIVRAQPCLGMQDVAPRQKTRTLCKDRKRYGTLGSTVSLSRDPVLGTHPYASIGCATLYDVVGSVKAHFECAIC